MYSSVSDSPTGLLVAVTAAIDFGDNSSEWANDGECDDPRFAGQWHMQPGECWAVLGRNGSGKRYLAGLLCGTEEIESGTVVHNFRHIALASMSWSSPLAFRVSISSR